MKITSLQDLQSMPLYGRVIDSTYSPDSELKKTMIGREYKIDATFHNNKAYSLAGHTFNFSDIQLLTPVEYKGIKIGIGDEISTGGENWCEVFDWYWFDDKFILRGAYNKNYSDTWPVAQNEIQDLRPLYPTLKEVELTIPQIAEKFGLKPEDIRIKDK